MIPVTNEHRKQELRTLLGQIRTHPSRDWSHARQRIVILQRMIADDAQRGARA
ncbi:MAG TPA: hypothetical protein VNS79_01175 [Sphingobium sp.]|nr:hypothetical protein [Sphingobium sp.]